MMTRLGLFLTGCLAVAACAPDPLGRERFVTREGQVVLHTGPAEPFEVAFKAGNGTPDYWCAAGRFAQQSRLSPGAPIYRVSPPPRRQGEGIRFSFTRPPGGGQPSGLVRIGPSEALSSSAARHQCEIIELQRMDF